MARRWVQLQVSIIDHYRLDMVTPEAFKFYVKCLALAGEVDDGGRLGTVAEVGHRLRLSPAQVEGFIEELEGRVAGEDQIYVRDWSDHQPPTTSADRMARHRGRTRERHSDDGVTSRPPPRDVTVTHRIEENRTEENRTEQTPSEPPKGGGWVVVAEALEGALGVDTRTASGRLYAWAGKAAKTAGHYARDDPLRAADLISEFVAWAKKAKYGSGRVWDFVNRNTFDDHFGKWAAEREAAAGEDWDWVVER